MKPLAVVALSLSLLSLAPATPVPASVQVLYLDEQAACTIFSVSQREKLWVTAGRPLHVAGAARRLGLAVRRAKPRSFGARTATSTWR